MKFSSEMIDALRAQIEHQMSPYRYNHTAQVERMALRLCELYAPEKKDILQVAALLHDITKEMSTDDHLKIIAEHTDDLGKYREMAPKTLHAISAALIIPESFAPFADDEVISAVRWHTTGCRDMTLCQRIIYLADYIDMSRTFADCVALREEFWSAEPQGMDMDERLQHLGRILLRSFDMTIKGLLEEGGTISADTIEARNSILREIS